MSEFTLTLSGKADADSVREAFDTAVRTIRQTVDDAFSLDGELTVDEETYTPDDVPDAADTGEETDEGETTDTGGEDPSEDVGDTVPVAPEV